MPLPPTAPATAASVRGSAGLALLAAATLDGAPENLALGISLTEGTGGIALLAAIFVSNLPEALVGSASMREQGRSILQIMGLWTACGVLLVFAVVIGAGPLSGTATPSSSRCRWPSRPAPSSRRSPTRSCPRPTSTAGPRWR